VAVECFQKDGEKPATAVLVVDELERDARSGRKILCAACGHVITSADARVRVGGEHAYERVNPIGITFQFGCFSTAPGCRPRGVPSKQATWFDGYWWYVQECAACAEHLGWLFFNDANQFYALILDRLTDENPAS
jgi:hypothetical protein